MREFTRGCLMTASGFGAVALCLAMVAQAQTTLPQLNRITAPFTVVSASGATLMRVEDHGGDPLLILTGKSGGRISLGARGDRLAIDMRYDENRHISLILEQENAVATVVMGGNDVNLIAAQDRAGVSVAHEGTEISHLGLKAGLDSAIRIFSTEGKPAVIIGAAAGSGGAGAVRVHDAAGGIAGFLHGLAGGGGEVGIARGGDPVVLLTSNQTGSGGLINVADAQGKIVFTAGARTDGGGGACIYNNEAGRCYGPFLP